MEQRKEFWTLLFVVDTLVVISLAGRQSVPHTNSVQAGFNQRTHQTTFSVNEFLGVNAKDFPVIPGRHIKDNYAYNLVCEGKCCHCDKLCMKFHTCCMDALWNTSNPMNMSLYKNLLIETSKKYKKLECVKIISSTRHVFDPVYFMVTSCLPGSNKLDKSNCLSARNSTSSTQSLIPVIGDDDYLYRNMHCARCNFVTKFQIVNVTVKCNSHHKQDDIRDDCSFEIADPHLHESSVRRCHASTSKHARTCAPTNKFYDLCHAYWSPLKKPSTSGIQEYYPNIHCHWCEIGIQEDLPLIDDNCSPYSHFRPPTWSILINFSRDMKMTRAISKKRGPIHYCNDGDLFSVFEEFCKPIKCLENYHVVEETCVKKKEGIELDLTNPSFDKCLNEFKLSTFLLEEKNERISIRRLSSTKNESSFDILNHIIIPNELLKEEAKMSKSMQPQVTSNLLQKDILKLIHSRYPILKNEQKTEEKRALVVSPVQVLITSGLHNISFPNSYFNGKVCQSPKKLINGDFTFVSNCNIKVNGTIYGLGDISMWITINKTQIMRHLTICDQFYLVSNCSLDVLHDNEVTIHANKSIAHRWSNGKVNTYSVNEYTPYDKGTAICSTQYSMPFTTIEMIEVYVTYIGSSLSILCYLIVIITYCSFKELQNVPGMCILSLTISLLVGDTMFLLASVLQTTGYNKISVLCTATATIMHFGFIMAHAWAVVIGYDIMVCIWNQLPISQDLTKFRHYTLASVASSLLIVFSAAILDQAGVVLTGYGNGDVCVPHLFYGRLFFYIIPSASTYIISLIFMIITITRISIESRRSNKVLEHCRRRNKNIALLALKLVLVLGVTEVVGFIQYRPSMTTGGGRRLVMNEVFALLYSFARSIRGIMLMAVYICRTNIIQLYNDVFQQRRRNKHVQFSARGLQQQNMAYINNVGPSEEDL